MLKRIGIGEVGYGSQYARPMAMVRARVGGSVRSMPRIADPSATTPGKNLRVRARVRTRVEARVRIPVEDDASVG